MERGLHLWAVIVALCSLSACAQHVFRDGGYPCGQIRLSVTDRQGQPLPNAVVRVLASDKSTPADGTPIEEHTADRPLVTAANGLIVCHVTPLPHFGGGGARLFGVSPRDLWRRSPYYYQASAEGYQPTTHGLERLFKTRTELTVTHEFRGQTYTLPVYEATVRLAPRE